MKISELLQQMNCVHEQIVIETAKGPQGKIVTYFELVAAYADLYVSILEFLRLHNVDFNVSDLTSVTRQVLENLPRTMPPSTSP